MPQLSAENRVVFFIGTLHALLKGFSVFYLLLLPILYALGIIGGEALGYIGALLIAGMMCGSLAITHALYRLPITAIFYLSLIIWFVASIFLFWPQNLALLAFAYACIGVASGFSMSTMSAVAGQFTTKGARFGALAKIAMYTDIVRMVYPLIASAIFAAFHFYGLIYFALAVVLGVAGFVHMLSKILQLDVPIPHETNEPHIPIKRNKPFWFAVAVEFLDAFASSQLFVFLPTLLIFKNFSIESALAMQSMIFLGYLSGRWLVGSLAKSVGGYKAVGFSEIGMVVTIILLLVVPPSVILYGVCFLLGIFTRGTSPVIKALLLDSLHPSQMRRGTGIYLTIGEAGSALAQLSFGLLLAWISVTAPFIAAALLAALVAVVCFVRTSR